MIKTIVNILDKGLADLVQDEVDAAFIRRVFRLRYASGLRSLSKFSFISAAVNRSSQTVRIAVLRAWASLPNIDEVISSLSEAISTEMGASNLTSISPAALAGKGIFSGMTADDIITLVHDLVSYREKTVTLPIFIVRKHGVSTLSVADKIDDVNNGDKDAFKPVALPPKAFSAVHLAKSMDGSGSLADDIVELASAIGTNGSNILSDRLGITNSNSSTLANVGEQYGVTRERIRQVTIGLLRQIMSVEYVSRSGPMTVLANICSKVDFSEKNIVPVSEVIEANDYLSGFSGNEKGLFILLSAAGIPNTIQSSGFYLYNPGISKDHALYEIGAIKAARASRGRRAKTTDHQQMMAVLPLDLISKVKELPEVIESSANMYYSKTLAEFCDSNPDKLPIECSIDWSNVGKDWRMVNMRLPVTMIERINDLASRLDNSRAALVYSVMKRNLDLVA